MTNLRTIHRLHRGRALNEELICGINGHGGGVEGEEADHMGLILPGTKRGAGFRKRSGDEFTC
jgi:hypothetical protein